MNIPEETIDALAKEIGSLTEDLAKAQIKNSSFTSILKGEQNNVID